MIQLNVVTLTGQSFDVVVFPFDTLREKLQFIQIGQADFSRMILFHKGTQISPDLTAAKLELETGDTVILYYKTMKKRLPIPSEFSSLTPKYHKRTNEEEAKRILDISITSHENGRDAKAYIRSIIEEQKESNYDVDDLELIPPRTVISNTSRIQTLPLPVCFEFDTLDYGREFDRANRSLSSLDPMRRNVIQDTPQSH